MNPIKILPLLSYQSIPFLSQKQKETHRFQITIEKQSPHNATYLFVTATYKKWELS